MKIWYLGGLGLLLATPLALGTSGATGDTAATVDRTRLHDKLEAVHLVVRAEVLTSAGVTVDGGERRWLQTLDVDEVLHQNHSGTSVAAGDVITFFTYFDDTPPPAGSIVSGISTAERMPVGDEAVYFLVEHDYIDAAGVVQDVWRAKYWSVDPDAEVDHLAVPSSPRGSVVAPIDYGGSIGLIAGDPPAGMSILRDDPDDWDWIIEPWENATSLATTRVEATTASTDGMPWATFLDRLRTAAGDL